MKKIIFIFSSLILLGILLFYYILNNDREIDNKNSNPFCSTENLLNENKMEGKRQFNINCAACHKLKGIVDPPLLQNKFKDYTLVDFKKFIYNQKRNRENIFEAKCKVFPKLHEEKIEYIYEYLSFEIN